MHPCGGWATTRTSRAPCCCSPRMPASTSPASGSPSTAASRSSREAERMPTPKLFGVEIPFVDHLGFDMVFMEGGNSELRYRPKPEHMNSFLVTHGGAIMTLLDVTLATAARSVDLEIGVVTIEMKTTFMRPCQGLLTGKGRLVHRT